VEKFKSWWLLALLFMAPPLYAEVVDKIVAVVNNEIILLSEMNAAFEPFRKRIETTYKGKERETALAESRTAFLNKLIDDTLIEQEAKKAGISIPDEDVMSAINDLISRRNIPRDDLIKELAKGGSSLDAYKHDIRNQMVKMNLLRREIKSKLVVTDNEIGEYYREHRNDYEGREAVRVKQIWLAFPSGAGAPEKEKMKRMAEEISGRLKKGDDFDALAAAYSAQTAAGGDLGFITKGVAFPAMEKAAFALKEGGVSEIIESPAGFHIIKVIEKRGGGLKPIEEVREEIRARIEEQKTGEKFQEWMETLRKKAHVEIKL